MNAAVMGRDAWKPEQPGGFGVGAAFALVAHVALVAALAFGVNWRSSAPDAALSAELWAAVPQVAAPKPVEPPPQPPQPEPKPTPPKPAPKPEPDPRIEQQRRDAQIAVEKAEREKKRREEQEEKERAEKAKADKLKAEKLKAEKEKAEKDKEKAREEKLREDKAKKDKADDERKRSEVAAKLREQQLARMRKDLAGEGPEDAKGNSSQDAAATAAYIGRIRAIIYRNLVLVGEVSGNPKVDIEVRCAPDGRIISRRVVKSSGNPVWDETVLRAIEKAEILPRNTDGRVPPSMVISYARQE